jgi:glycosyltransferase involved in cell wall biosynthesis
VWWACDFDHRSKQFIGRPNERRRFGTLEVVMIHGPGYKRNVGVARLIHLAVHARNLRRAIARETVPDVILGAIPSIEATFAVSQYAGSHRVPLIVDIRDEWPEDFVRWLPGFLKSIGRIALRGKFRRLGASCSSAAAIVGVTQRQLTYGVRFSGRDQRQADRVFYTGANDHGTVPDPEIVHRWQHGPLAGIDFVVVHAGTMSKSRPLRALIAAVRSMSRRHSVRLILAGGGDQEAACREAADGDPAIWFAGWLDAREMRTVLLMSNAVAAMYHPDYGFSLPTKFFDYLAAGRPIISSCPGEARELIEKEAVGLVVDPEDARDMEAALVRLHLHPEEADRMGDRARKLFLKTFDLRHIRSDIADYLEVVAQGGPRDASC